VGRVFYGRADYGKASNDKARRLTQSASNWWIIRWITFANFQNKRKHCNATSAGCNKTIISTLKTIERCYTVLFWKKRNLRGQGYIIAFSALQKKSHRWPVRVLPVEWDKATVPPQLSLFTALIAYLERKLWYF
jgi:hypothetical protein